MQGATGMSEDVLHLTGMREPALVARFPREAN
jgi:hypothetical protein